MSGLTPKELKTQARERLSQAAYSPKKLTLWYSGMVLGLNLLSVLLSWITGMMAENTGGLSGMDTRAVLDTVSTVFSLAVQIVTPLLTMGFLYCCVRLARQTDVQPKTLAMGFRRWAVILRHGLLVGGIFLAVLYLAIQIGSIIFMFLPSSQTALDMMYALMEDPAVLEGDLSPALLEQLVDAFMPVYIISGILFIVAFLPLSYRLRLSNYRIMEDAPVGAVKAVLGSNKLMKGSCWALFRLDLSFWWFYLLQTALSVSMAVVSLALTLSDGWYTAISAVYAAATLALEYFALAHVQTTYALFYQKMLEKANTPAQPQIEE